MKNIKTYEDLFKYLVSADNGWYNLNGIFYFLIRKKDLTYAIKLDIKRQGELDWFVSLKSLYFQNGNEIQDFHMDKSLFTSLIGEKEVISILIKSCNEYVEKRLNS